jgi:hypothetical protein
LIVGSPKENKKKDKKEEWENMSKRKDRIVDKKE